MPAPAISAGGALGKLLKPSDAVPRYVGEWRPSVDETDNYVSAGAL